MYIISTCFCHPVIKSCPTLCELMGCSLPDFPVLYYLPKFAQTCVCGVSDAIQPSHPLLPPSPFAFSPPSIKVFPSESALCIRWPKYCSFSISPSNEYSGLISSRTDWFDPLAVQWTLESSRAPQLLRRELKRVFSPLSQCWVLATATLS